MKRIFILGLLFAACSQQPTPVNINITNNNTATNTTSVTIHLGGESQSVDPTCPSIARLRIETPTSVSVSATTFGQVSMTPLTTEGKERPARCDEADGLTWSYPVTGFLLGSNNAFVTTIRGLIPGQYALSARVGSASGSVPITIVP